jgi:hypothetical protein
MIAVRVAAVVLIRWSRRRSDEILDFYDEDEKPRVVETMPYMNESCGHQFATSAEFRTAELKPQLC